MIREELAIREAEILLRMRKDDCSITALYDARYTGLLHALDGEEVLLEYLIALAEQLTSLYNFLDVTMQKDLAERRKAQPTLDKLGKNLHDAYLKVHKEYMLAIGKQRSNLTE